ncbi:hypothetical protein WICPIJ_002964 [Wickerhamomyces pijperi]|uniref:Uncharacterized protein n=1 Tax=Wickerhamomyces pijperi TaxID=599730 RepID=A0A9P8TPA9_WICPI|nr:hypothetical protein WICPIJ_002964 [Wickerhamomyces pijperi]
MPQVLKDISQTSSSGGLLRTFILIFISSLPWPIFNVAGLRETNLWTSLSRDIRESMAGLISWSVGMSCSPSVPILAASAMFNNNSKSEKAGKMLWLVMYLSPSSEVEPSHLIVAKFTDSDTVKPMDIEKA